MSIRAGCLVLRKEGKMIQSQQKTSKQLWEEIIGEPLSDERVKAINRRVLTYCELLAKYSDEESAA